MSECELCGADNEAGDTARENTQEDQRERVPILEDTARDAGADTDRDRNGGKDGGVCVDAFGAHLRRRDMVELRDSDSNRLCLSPLYDVSFQGRTLFHEERSQVARLLDDGARVRSSKLGTLPAIQLEQRGRIGVDTWEETIKEP